MNHIEAKSRRVPIIGPVIEAAKSRRVLIALATIIVGAGVLAFPELESVEGPLVNLLAVLALVLIGGLSVEDAAAAFQTNRRDIPNSPDELRAEIRNVAVEFLDAMLTGPLTEPEVAEAQRIMRDEAMQPEDKVRALIRSRIDRSAVPVNSSDVPVG